MTLPDNYKPVKLNVEKSLAEAMKRPGFQEAWDALEEEYSALQQIINARTSYGS